MVKGKKQKRVSKMSRPRRSASVKGGMAAAPAAVSSFRRQYVNFKGQGESLIIDFRIAIANVGQPGVAGLFGGMIDGLGQSIGSESLSPTAPRGILSAGGNAFTAFTSPALDLLASGFARYRLKKCVFEYCPQSGTNSTQELVFAFAADPSHPIVYPQGAVVPSTQSLLAVSDSLPFAPWSQWDMDVTRKLDREAKLFTFSAPVDNPATADTSRFDNWGAISLVCATASTATAVNFGVLYMCAEIELMEMCPISVTRPALLSLHGKLNFHVKSMKEVSRRTKQGLPSLDVDQGDSEGWNEVPRERKLRPTPLVEQSAIEDEFSISDFDENRDFLDRSEFIAMYKGLRDDGISPQQSITQILGEFDVSESVIKMIGKLSLAKDTISKDVRSKAGALPDCPVSQCPESVVDRTVKISVPQRGT